MIESNVQAPEALSSKSISRSACVALVAFVALIEFLVPFSYSMISGFGLWWDGILIPAWFLFHLAALATVAAELPWQRAMQPRIWHQSLAFLSVLER